MIRGALLRVTQPPDPFRELVNALQPILLDAGPFPCRCSEGENSIPSDQAFSGEVTWKPSLSTWEFQRQNGTRICDPKNKQQIRASSRQGTQDFLRKNPNTDREAR